MVLSEVIVDLLLKKNHLHFSQFLGLAASHSHETLSKLKREILCSDMCFFLYFFNAEKQKFNRTKIIFN